MARDSLGGEWSERHLSFLEIQYTRIQSVGYMKYCVLINETLFFRGGFGPGDFVRGDFARYGFCQKDFAQGNFCPGA